MSGFAIWRARRAPQAFVAVALGLFSPFAIAAPADDVKALFERGEARQAYELARKTPEELGNPSFDYYYGMAAIDAGAVGQGVLALERFLLNNPGSVSARLELGRGYYLMGDNTRAREMFDEVRKLSPPADVEIRIQGYLAAIREKESGYRTAFTGFVEVGGGHDSNVNGGIAQETIVVPLFGPVQIDPLGREIADRFWSLQVGATVNVPLSPRVAVFAGAGAEHRKHADAGAFDQTSVGLAAGAAFKRRDDQYRVSLSGNTLDVDGEKYRRVTAATFEWNRSLDARRGFGVFTQAADVGYEGGNRVRDSRLYSLGATWRQSMEGPWKPYLAASLVGAREQNDQDRDDLARNLIGARVGVGLTLSPRWNASLSTAFQQSRYQGTDLFFGVSRKDHNVALEVAFGWMLMPGLGLRLELARHDNRSNIALFEYDRTLVALKLRYDFK